MGIPNTNPSYIDTADEGAGLNVISTTTEEILAANDDRQYCSISNQSADRVFVVTPTITYADTPNIATRASGSYIADGFKVGDMIVISGSTSNDGTYTITALTATVLTQEDGAWPATGADTNDTTFTVPTSTISLGFGEDAVDEAGVVLLAGETWCMPSHTIWTGAIDVIAKSGTPTIAFVEW